MSTDTLATAPPFTIAGATFRCWITDAGQRFEWRSTCGRYRVGRRGYTRIDHPDGRSELITHHFAIADGRDVGTRHRSLREAMLLAIQSSSGRAAA